MSPTTDTRQRVLLTLAALFLVALHLGWEMMHGGVKSHNILARADLPAFSNWWGVVLVPLIAWFSFGFRAWPALVGALVYGAALSSSYSFGVGVEKYLFLGLFGISLLVATYRIVYMLGFVLGMMFTFGAVLPTIIAAIIGAFAWCVHALIAWVRKRMAR